MLYFVVILLAILHFTGPSFTCHGIPWKLSTKVIPLNFHFPWQILRGIPRGQKHENSAETPWNFTWNRPTSWNYHGTRRASAEFSCYCPRGIPRKIVRENSVE